MEDFRRHISAYPEEFLTLIKTVEESVGQKITADCYKRPKPCENPDLMPYFAWKGQIACVREEAPNEGIFSPELSQRVKELLLQLRPLYDYFNRFKA